MKFTVHHTTVYRYARAVAFGPHRMMLRPRDSHDLRLVATELVLSPPADLHWLHDVFGNSVATASFREKAAELRIESTLHLERFALERPAFRLASDAATYPFVYSSEDRTDLGRQLERHSPDPTGMIEAWARSFVTQKPMDTLELLASINSAIKAQFAYAVRDEEGTQTPIETLERHSGTCRDYAFLMMEAVRSLGFGARFVSGYLYDPKLDGLGDDGTTGAGATHAWCEIYLPGAGWVEYDPTNALIGSAALIRVAVTRDPAQAVPVSGSFIGRAEDYQGLSVEVVVTRGDPPGAASPTIMVVPESERRASLG
ncbi:MAG TPA: transglutaminase family protein [Beijerinckiaceae bacterium]|jgi:transglutaminase-like putative cysteine protease